MFNQPLTRRESLRLAAAGVSTISCQVLPASHQQPVCGATFANRPAKTFLFVTLNVLFVALPSAAAEPAADPLLVAARIDAAVAARLKIEKSEPAAQTNDAEFLRRVFLDLNGRIPSRDELAAFLADRSGDKRARIIDELLTRPDYGEHFGVIWRKLLVDRDGDNQQLHDWTPFEAWLIEQFQKNRPWNELVSAMVGAEGATQENAAGYFYVANHDMYGNVSATKVVNTVSTLFMGVRLECAQCHDHPEWNDVSRSDYWSLAAFFGQTRLYPGGLNMGYIKAAHIVSETRVGKLNKEANRFPEGPTIDIIHPVDMERTEGVARARYFHGAEAEFVEEKVYRPAFVRWLTAADNPWFARNLANRLWAYCFARGLVQPLDNLHASNPPTHPEILDLLAAEAIASGFDQRHLLRCICNSQTYQRTSRDTSETDEENSYAHMAVKVLDAEVLRNSLLVALEIVKPGAPPATGKNSPAQQTKTLVKTFTTRAPEANATEYNHGIPQFLLLLNSKLNEPIVEGLLKSQLTEEAAVDQLVLATLSRHPTDSERRLMVETLKSAANPRSGYSLLLRALINSAEFTMNH